MSIGIKDRLKIESLRTKEGVKVKKEMCIKGDNSTAEKMYSDDPIKHTKEHLGKGYSRIEEGVTVKTCTEYKSWQVYFTDTLDKNGVTLKKSQKERL